VSEHGEYLGAEDHQNPPIYIHGQNIGEMKICSPLPEHPRSHILTRVITDIYKNVLLDVKCKHLVMLKICYIMIKL